MLPVSGTTANIIVHAGPLVMVLHVLHAGRKRATLPDMEGSLTTIHCITAFFCQVDAYLAGLSASPAAQLWPREVVTVGRLPAHTGVGNRALDRWLTRDDRTLFSQLPECTRLAPLPDPAGLD